MANPDNFIFSIVNQSGATKLQKLIDAVSTAINQKKLGLGEILPSVNQLSGKLNISRDTVFKAYKELVRRGLIVSSPTKGYFVAGSNSKILLLLDEFSPFKDVLYESFAHNLPGNYQVDLAFHHYNHRI